MTFKPQFSKSFFLAAGQCNAEGMLPLQWLVQRLIDVATLHANSIDIGYSHLRKHNASWVLHQVSICMESYPEVNEDFTIETWIVATNPLKSDRAYRIVRCDGTTAGYALTTWVAIDVDKRSVARLDKIFPDSLPDTGVYPPIERFRKISVPENSETLLKYRFCYTDLDCNRHVTTRRYVELMLNCLSLDFLDRNMVSSFELSFHSEALFNQDVEVRGAISDDKPFELALYCQDKLLSSFRLSTVKIERH